VGVNKKARRFGRTQILFMVKRKNILAGAEETNKWEV